jgi:hypothetical protein
MNQVQADHREIRPSARESAVVPALATRAAAIGAVAFGVLAVGAIAIGALAIGRLVVGAFALKRGRVHTLTVDNLEVLRLHVRELAIDSNMSRSM